MSDNTASIAFNGSLHVILCGFCEAPISKQAEIAGDPREWGCSACGNWDFKDEIRKIALDYAKIEKQIQTHKIAQYAAEKSRIMLFFGKTAHDRPHSFIVKFKL